MLGKLGNEFHGLAGGGLAGHEHFGVGERGLADAGGGVGEAGKGGNADAALARDNRFRHRAHADGISAERGERTNLRRCLIARPTDSAVYSAMQFGLCGAGGFRELFGKHGIVSLGEINEYFLVFIVKAMQRIVTDEIEVISE